MEGNPVLLSQSSSAPLASSDANVHGSHQGKPIKQQQRRLLSSPLVLHGSLCLGGDDFLPTGTQFIELLPPAAPSEFDRFVDLFIIHSFMVVSRTLQSHDQNQEKLVGQNL